LITAIWTRMPTQTLERTLPHEIVEGEPHDQQDDHCGDEDGDSQLVVRSPLA